MSSRTKRRARKAPSVQELRRRKAQSEASRGVTRLSDGKGGRIKATSARKGHQLEPDPFTERPPFDVIQAPGIHAAAVARFVETKCEGRQYDSCVSSPCPLGEHRRVQPSRPSEVQTLQYTSDRRG